MLAYIPKVPGLRQYVSTGTYYARVKVRGKSIRQTLGTDVFTTAKLRRPDKLKELRKPQLILGTFSEDRGNYETALDNDHTLSPLSKTYYRDRLKHW